MMLRRLLIGLLFHPICFANMNDSLATMQLQGDEIRQSISQASLAKWKVASDKNRLDIPSSLQTQLTKQGGKPVDGAVLFVSLSMPKRLLLQLTDEASYYEIPVVIKGLEAGDFKKTLIKIAELQQAATQEHVLFKGLSIDPVWFEQFKITAVPALVVTHRPAECEFQRQCANQPFDVIYGNQSIKKSLELMRERGQDAFEVAKHLLEVRDA